MRRLGGSFAALGDRPFRLLFAAQTISLLGDGLALVALTFAVLDLTGSASDLGLVLASRTVPLVGLLLVGGVFADRLSRRSVMVVADLTRLGSQGLTAALLLSRHAQIWQLAVLQAVHGAASAFFNPAPTGLVPMTVSPEHLQQANGLRALSTSGANIVGPIIGGLLVALAGAGWALAVDAATFAASAAFLARLGLAAQVHPPARSFLHDLRAGWHEFRGRTWVWLYVTWASLGNLGMAAFMVLGAVVARQSLGGAAAWGLIMAAFGAGALLGSISALQLHVHRPLVVAAGTLSALALPAAAMALALPLLVVAVAALAGGGALMLANTLWETALQRHIPTEALSRVSAYDWFGSLAFTPIGYALAGPLGARIGVAPTLWIVAAFFALSAPCIAALPSMRGVRERADGPATASPESSEQS
jgi:MFS family permease